MKRLHFVLIFILDTEWLFGYLVPNLIHYSFVPVFHSPHRQLLNEGARRRNQGLSDMIFICLILPQTEDRGQVG